MKTKLPMGIENFREIRRQKFYYVDKTALIRELLENWGKVNLFTRPRRFGKTLNMSMLKCFFEIGSDSALFDGLEISKETQLCEEYLGKFPVISITLKGATGRTFDEAKSMLRNIIGNEAMRYQFLMQSEHLTEIERKQYAKILSLNDDGEFAMSDVLLKSSLFTLTQLLKKHYGQDVIMLIDEYDVPLDKAYQSGYYDDMVELIRSLFGNAFKTNDSLYFAVLTGCLRISKESNVSAYAETSEKRLERFSQTSPQGDVLFTGLNNFNVYTVKDVQYHEAFGFTDVEVRQMLEDYGFMEKYDAIKAWYDGYRFGTLDIYCPWDVVSYCHALKMKPTVTPKNYWVNTSSNDIVRRFVSRANTTTRDEIEVLIDGGSVKKRIRQELTYRDLDSNIDNLWSILFTTGYLTQRGFDSNDLTELVIPNREIRWIFVQQIREWFQEESVKDRKKLESFCRAFQENDTKAIEKGFNEYLWNTISIRDTSVRKEMKENFYQGILLGLLAYMDGWLVKSNAESGEGYSDISIEIRQREIGIVIELKYAENGTFDASCQEALRQIHERKYETALIENGLHTIYRYGIACYKKRCKVVSECFEIKE